MLAMSEAAHELVGQYGYLGLFVLLMLGIVGLPVPDEPLLAAAGFLVRRGELHSFATFGVGLLGSMCGITLSFIIGRTVGYRVVHRCGRWVRLSEDRFARFHRWYQRTGRWALTLGYFVPGFRHAVAIIAGISRLSWPSFGLFAYSGAVLWVSTFLIAGYVLGEQWEQGSARAERLIVLGLLALLAAVLACAVVRHVRSRVRPAGSGSSLHSAGAYPGPDDDPLRT